MHVKQEGHLRCLTIHMKPAKLAFVAAAIVAGIVFGIRQISRSLAAVRTPAGQPSSTRAAQAQESPDSAPAASDAFLAHEVWVALRTDGQAGSGTVSDPFDASGVSKLNALFEKFRKEYSDNLTVHFGPGVFYGDREWTPGNNWHILGAGMDITIFKTAPNPERIETVGFRPLNVTGFVLSDVTFDFNVSNLRKANRVFTYSYDRRRRVCYFYSTNLPSWMPGKLWKVLQAVIHKGREYMCVKDTNTEPGASPDWSPLRSNHPESLPAWKSGVAYRVGDAVSVGRTGYILLRAGTTSDPVTSPVEWAKINPDAIDPYIYTVAAFGGDAWPQPGGQPSGRNRVSRVRAVNCNGSSFFGREDFVIGLGGNDCVVEDCVVEQFQGDYASLIVLMNGRNSVVRGCTVRGNGKCFAYGGWACFNAVYEDNYCENVDTAVNIDSLNNRNVTLRNNTFVDCHRIGILINFSGVKHQSFPDHSGMLNGRKLDLNEHRLEGLYIYNNYVERPDGAPYGAIQTQQHLLQNVQIHDNILRTASGRARDRAIGVLEVHNASVYNNRCDPNMYCEISRVTGGRVCYGNYDFNGKPMTDYAGRPIDNVPQPSVITR